MNFEKGWYKKRKVQDMAVKKNTVHFKEVIYEFSLTSFVKIWTEIECNQNAICPQLNVWLWRA